MVPLWEETCQGDGVPWPEQHGRQNSHKTGSVRVLPPREKMNSRAEGAYTLNLRRRVSRPIRTPPSSMAVTPPSGAATKA